MINRIVRMSFDPLKITSFLKIFNESKNQIAQFEGCEGVTLLRDVKKENVFFTYSLWQDEQSLDSYRHSELFEKVWSETKKLFNDKPHAWSTVIIDEVNK